MFDLSKDSGGFDLSKDTGGFDLSKDTAGSGNDRCVRASSPPRKSSLKQQSLHLACASKASKDAVGFDLSEDAAGSGNDRYVLALPSPRQFSTEHQSSSEYESGLIEDLIGTVEDEIRRRKQVWLELQRESSSTAARATAGVTFVCTSDSCRSASVFFRSSNRKGTSLAVDEFAELQLQLQCLRLARKGWAILFAKFSFNTRFEDVLELCPPRSIELMRSKSCRIDCEYIDQTVGKDILRKSSDGLRRIGLNCKLNTHENLEKWAVELAKSCCSGKFYLVALGSPEYSADFTINYDPHHIFDAMTSLMSDIESLRASHHPVGHVANSDKFQAGQVDAIRTVLDRAVQTIGRIKDSSLDRGELVNLAAGMLSLLGNGSNNNNFRCDNVLAVVEPSEDPWRPRRIGAIKFFFEYIIEDISSKKVQNLECTYRVQQWHVVFNNPQTIRTVFANMFGRGAADAHFGANVPNARSTTASSDGQSVWRPGVPEVLPQDSVSSIGNTNQELVELVGRGILQEEMELTAFDSDESIVSPSEASWLVAISDRQEPKCFLPHTLVKTATGQFISVCNLAVGDRLLSWQDRVVQVRSCIVHPAADVNLVELHTSRGASLPVTESHRIIVERQFIREDIAAGNLVQGDAILCSAGSDALLRAKAFRQNTEVVELVLDPDEVIEAFLPPHETILSRAHQPRHQSRNGPNESLDGNRAQRRTRRSGQWRRDVNSGRRTIAAPSIPETHDSFA